MWPTYGPYDVRRFLPTEPNVLSVFLYVYDTVLLLWATIFFGGVARAVLHFTSISRLR